MPDKKNNAPRRKALTMNSPWLQNTLKSMGISATNALSDLMPATAGTLTSGARLASDTAKTIRATKGGSRMVQNAIKNNQLVKTGQDFFKNALDDLRSGDWSGHDDRGSMGDMFDDMDTMFGDMDEMFGEDETTDVNVENNITADSGASIRAMEKQTEYTVRAAQATVDTMVSIGSATLIKAEELGNKVLNELTGINSTLNAILDYQNSNMTRFIEASIGYYEQMSTAVESSSYDESIKPENLYGDRGLDFGTYKDFVLQNIKNLKNEDGSIGMLQMFLENAPDMLANPMDMAAKGIIKAMIPSVTKNAMAAVDQSMKDFVPYLLERIGSLGEGQIGMQGTALQYIGKIFGTKTTAKKELDFSNIKTGPIPYNGKANHTLTEIIPKYLRESNNYLRVIAEHLTGKSEDELAGSVTGFNWQTGRFQKMDDMKKSMQEDYIVQVLSGLETSEFGKKFLATANTVLENSSDAEGMGNILQQILLNGMRSGKRFNFGDEGQIQEIVDGISGTETQKNFVMEFLSQMKEQRDEVLGNLENLRISTVRKNNTLLRGLNDANGENGIYQLYAGKSNEDILADINAYLRGSQNGGSGGTSEDGGTPPPIPGPAPTIQSRESLREAIRTNQNDELDLEEINNSGGGVRGATGRAAAKPLRAFAGVLNGIMAGNADAAWDAFIAGFGETFKRAGTFISEHFLNPVKGALFGEKNEDGYIKGGLFGGINNRMKESFYGLRRMITGKGYKDAEGNMIADANEDEMKNTVIGKLRSSVNWMKDAISVRLFGKKTEDGEYETDDDGKAKDGLLGKAKRGIAGATSSLLRGLTGWKHALFGKSDDEEDEETEGKKIFEDLKKKAADVAPSAMTGAIGGGILGMFVGGPIGGALLGFAGGIASKSDRFKNWLFGTDEKDGVIPKKVQDYVKENSKFLAGGTAIGALKGAITGGGVLGTLVGGPIAGALMGLGTSIFLKSDMFQKFLFGDPEKGQLGMKQHVSRWMKKLGSNAGTGDASGGKLAGMMGVGAIGGGILGMMIGGPVIGALGGLSLSILAQKDNFKEWLFGKVDEKTGEKKEGILGQFRNMLITDVFTPIGNSFKNIGDDFKTFLRYDILGKANLIFERIGDSFFGAVSRITGTAMASIGDFGSYIKDNFLKNIVDGMGKVFAPLTKAATIVAEGVYSAGKAIISAPLNLMMTVLSPAVSAITNVIGTIGGAMVKTVDLILVKPVKNLILKPLGAAVKVAGKVIAAPFKMVANVFDWVNNTLVAGIGHVTRFVSAIGDHIKKKFTENIIDPIKKKVGDFTAKVKDFVMKPVDIVAGFAKDIFTAVGEYAKEKISGFFSSALHFMNPLTWMKGMARLGSAALNVVSGGRIGKGPKEKPESSGSGGGWLGQLWRDTKAGTGKDHSSEMIYKDGELVDTKMTWAQRAKALREERNAERAGNKITKQDRKNIAKNQQMIRKYTKNQRFEDTEENRMLAEAAVGHKLDWGKVEAKKTDFEQKTLNYQDESLSTAEVTKEYIKDIAQFILGNKFRDRGEDPDKLKQAAEEAGAKLQSRRDARQEVIRNAEQDESYHAKRDAKDAKAVDTRVRKREDKVHREDIINDVHQHGLWSTLKNITAFSRGRIKGIQQQNDEEIPANAEGTSGAKPGFSIVGEKGPEVIYGKNAKTGRFVGLNGPEVVRMAGGETVIPNSKLPRYEDGTELVCKECGGKLRATSKFCPHCGTPVFSIGRTGNKTDAKIAKTDDAIAKATDTSKLTLGERVLRALSEIKTAILSKVGAATPQVSAPASSVTGELNEEPQAAATLAPVPSGNIITDSSSTDMVNDGEENSMADQLSAQAVVSTKTGEALRAEHAAIEEQAEDDARMDAMLAAMQGTHEETKKHGISWDSIFSKKGLITAALIAALPLLLKFLNSGLLQSILDALGGLGSRILDGVGAAVGNAIHQGVWTYENDALENGETVGQRTEKAIARVAGLQIFDENGQADHISYPFAKALARMGLTFANSGVKLAGESSFTSGVKGISNIVKGLGGAANRGLTSIVNFGKDTNALSNLVATYGDDALELADNGLMAAGAKGLNFVKTTANKVANSKVVQGASGFIDNAAQAVSTKAGAVVEKLADTKGGKLLTYVCDTIQSFFKSMIAKFNAKTGLKAGETILSKINPAKIIGYVKSGWDNICVKISELLGGRIAADAVSAGLMEAVFVGLSAINGVSGTAKLFHVRSDQVDAKMRIIAGLFGGILGTTPGAVIDLVCALVYDMSGIDVLCSLATGFYNFWAGEDEGAKLEDAQKVFEGDYVEYQSAEISKQYETQRAAGLISSDMTLEQFSEEAHAGNLGIDYKSFANYNADVNASFGDKAMQVLSSGWGGIKKGWNWLTGTDEISYTDDKGNIYTKNDDGTYQVTSADGKDLGYVAENALQQGNMTEVVKENDNIFQIAGKGLANLGSSAWNGIKGAGEWIGGGLASAGNSIVDTGKKVAEVATNKWNAFKDGVKWLTSRETTTGYYDADGTYYLQNGEHYTANNELIETINLSDLSAMIVSGQLSEPTEIITKDFGFITAFNDAKNKLSEGWNNAIENAQKFGANIVQKAKDFGASASKAFKNAKVSVTNFFTKHNEKAWFDTDGSYWKMDGKNAVHYNATGSQIGDPLNEEEFAALLAAGSFTEGEIQVDSGLSQKINSFGKAISEGWNKFSTSAINFGNDLVQKAGNVFNKAKETLGNAVTSVGNFLMAHTEKRYHDTQGGYYQSNGNTFDYYNQNGDLITEGISAEEFASIVQSGAVSENDVEEVTVNSGIRNWFNEVAQSGKEAYTKWHDSAVAMWGPVKEKAGAAVKAIAEAGGPIAFIGGLFTKKTEKAWYDTNGNYYKLESGGKYTKYNMNGDILEENIDPEKIQELAEAGLLTEGDVVVDTAAQKAVKEIKSAVKDAWSAAKDTVKNGWEAFKSWITGGSGTNASVINNYRPSNENTTVPGGSGYGPKGMFIRGGKGESEPTNMNGIPYYSQNDRRWANNSYEPLNESDGATMGNTGCGPAAMSMVIGKMTGEKALPTELASYAQFTGTRDDTGTNWNFIDSAASTYGLKSSRSVMPSKEFISNNLSKGNPMVLSGQSDNSGPYTRAGHYIVATGVDSSGNVTYNDPRGASYSGTMNIDDFINNTGAAWSFTGPDAPRGSYGTSSISNRQKFNLYEWTRGGRGFVAQDASMGGGVKTQSGSGVTSNDIISIALNEVGYFAKRSNSDLDSKTANALGAGQYNGYCKYARDTWPGKNGLAWCAMFVCWVFKMAANGKEDVAKKLLCGGGYSAGCTQMLKAFGGKGQLISKNSTPIPGDVVLFNWDNGNSTTTAQHVGIVVGVNGDKVTTVEGNTSATSQGHGGCVEKKDRSRKNIICFCRPIYDNTSNFQGLSSLGGTDGGFATTLSSTGASLSGNILSDYSSLFSAFANASFNAALTGNTDIDWNAVYSGASTGTGTSVGSTEYSTSGGVVDPGDINERTKKVVEFFRSKGINDAAIAGVLGCWKAESGVTPGKIEGYYLKGYPAGLNYATDRGAVDSFTKNTLFPAYARSGISINKNAYYGQDGHLYPGAGLAQWTGPRGQAYANMFATKGYKFGQIEPELDMMWSELNGGCRSYALAPWKAVTTPEAGADVFCRKFEGYSGSGIKKRQEYARGFYNSMSSIANGTGGGSGEGIPESDNGPTISRRRYSIATPEPVEGGRGEMEKVRTPINTHQLPKTSKLTQIVSGGMGTGYDDSMVLQLLNQIANFLGTITTNTKNLDLLNDIRKMSGGSNVNLTTVTGGDTTVNTVNSSTTRKSGQQTSTVMTRQENNARRIAGIM